MTIYLKSEHTGCCLEIKPHPLQDHKIETKKEKKEQANNGVNWVGVNGVGVNGVGVNGVGINIVWMPCHPLTSLIILLVCKENLK